jgi:hypothetical protein
MMHRDLAIVWMRAEQSRAEQVALASVTVVYEVAGAGLGCLRG